MPGGIIRARLNTKLRALAGGQREACDISEQHCFRAAEVHVHYDVRIDRLDFRRGLCEVEAPLTAAKRNARRCRAYPEDRGYARVASRVDAVACGREIVRRAFRYCLRACQPRKLVRHRLTIRHAAPSCHAAEMAQLYVDTLQKRGNVRTGVDTTLRARIENPR